MDINLGSVRGLHGLRAISVGALVLPVGPEDKVGRRKPLRPTAVVVNDDILYGIILTMQMLVDVVCIIRPFRSIAEATNWLRVWGASL